jgi:predicted Zn-dependent peptidase
MGTMQDRQKFSEQKLPNGITLHTYQSPFPICHLEVILPVGAGHAHTGNSFIPGSPHFLEHAQLIRSDRFPDAYQLDRLIGLRGGHSNGTTYPVSTHYELDMPAAHLDFAVEAMLDRTYSPIFVEDDLKPERGVVMNERNGRKFYPGRSPVSKYYHTEFLNDAEYPLEQLFGSNDDLHDMTADVLLAMQRQISLNEGVKVLAVGPSDFSGLAAGLAKIRTTKAIFNCSITPIHWNDPSYRKCYFETVSQPTLEVAWVHPRMPYAEFRAASLLVSLLVNPTHGSLYREFREEKGWAYGLDGYCQQRPHNTVIGLSFPVNAADQVDYIRDCLQERIRKAAADQALVEAEIGRYVSSQVYNFQTAGDIIGGASYDLDTYGCIHTETEWLTAVENVANPDWRRYIVTTYFQEADMGAICFMPERRRRVLARDLSA